MIELKNISKVYKTKYNQVQALKDINLSFSECGLVFILGKSGCGKSTMLNLLGGLDNATSGEIVVDGSDIAKLKQGELDYFRNYNVGFVFQEYNLVDEYNVFENIELALDLQGDKTAKEKVTAALEKVDLAGYEKRKIKELSGGQQQRVAIARALVKNSTYILADEPTGNLDSATSDEIFTLLKELSKEKLIIVVSHDKENAEQYGDRIIEMKDGMILNDRLLNDNRQEDIQDQIEHKQTSQNQQEKDDKTCDTPSKIGTKRKKTSIKQIFQFASRNMWRRWIRLTASIVMCVVSLTAMILSIATADQFNVGLAFSQVYKDVDTVAFIKDMDAVEENDNTYNCKKLSGEVVSAIKKDLAGYYLPVYDISDKNGLSNIAFTTIDSETFANFEMKVQAKDSALNYFLPQEQNQIAIFAPYFKYKIDGFSYWYNEQQGMDYTSQIGKKIVMSGNFNCEMKVISYITFDICSLYEQTLKEVKEFYKGNKQDRTEADFESIAAYMIMNSYTKIDYVVCKKYVDEIYPNQINQKILFNYQEKCTDNTQHVSSSGYLMPYNFAKNHIKATDIYCKNGQSLPDSLKNEEMLVSLEFAKALLTTVLNKNIANITEQDVKDAIDNGSMPKPNINSVWRPADVTVLGYYNMADSQFSWKDSISTGSDFKHTRLSQPPILMSDNFNNVNVKPINTGVSMCVVAFDKVKPTEKFFNTLAQNNAFVSLMHTKEWNGIQTAGEQLDVNKKIYGYISLGLGILTAIIMFSYILTIIKDSKRKIGILRGVGMNSFSIAIIYLLEAIILGLIAAIIAIPVAFGINSIDVISSISMTLIGIKTIFIGAEEIFAAIGTSLLIAITGAIVPILIYSRKTPVSLMRSKK